VRATYSATQSAQLGYELDSRWFGIDTYAKFMRDRLAKLTREDVAAALKKHLQAADVEIVYVTKDAEGLKQALLASEPTTIKYDAPKPPELMAEDKIVGALPLGLTPEKITIVPVDQVFAK